RVRCDEGADFKKVLRLPECRPAVKFLSEEQRLSISRSCQCMELSRSAYYREQQDRLPRDQPVIDALNGLVEEFPRLGF
ncbi:MAG: IS3 family transposase, partial [Gammaproteobacteria bacterium]|nr:IS3 family transposase [Gammaproteobacteria bacterium]